MSSRRALPPNQPAPARVNPRGAVVRHAGRLYRTPGHGSSLPTDEPDTLQFIENNRWPIISNDRRRLIENGRRRFAATGPRHELAHRPSQRRGERLPQIRARRGSRPERLNPARNVRARRNFRDQALDFTLGAKARSSEKPDVVLRSEIRRKQQEPREVNRAFREHLEQNRKLTSHPRRTCPALSLVLGKAKLVETIRVERRTRAFAVDPTRLDLPKVRKQVGREEVVSAGERLHLRVQNIVGNPIEAIALRVASTV